MSLENYWTEAELYALRHANGARILKELPTPDFTDLHGVAYWRPETIGAALAKQAEGE
jgi:hypothetical protein